jgi:hypothetical protein
MYPFSLLYLLELSTKFPKLGPRFCQNWEWKWEVSMKTVHRNKSKGSNSFSHLKLVLRGVSPLILDLPSLHLHCWLIFHNFSLNQAFVRYKRSCKSSVLVPIFLKWYPILLILWLPENLGWTRDQRVKLGPKQRVTLEITLLGHTNFNALIMYEHKKKILCYCLLTFTHSTNVYLSNFTPFRLFKSQWMSGKIICQKSSKCVNKSKRRET